VPRVEVVGATAEFVLHWIALVGQLPPMQCRDGNTLKQQNKRWIDDIIVRPL